MLFLDEDQVRKHLRMGDLIPAMEKALIDFSTGKVTQPVRQVIAVDPPGGFYGMMPALTPEGLGQKIVTFYPPNAEKDLPTHGNNSFERSTNWRTARGHGWAIDYGNANSSGFGGGDEPSCLPGRKDSRDARQRRASAESRGRAATGQTIRGNSRLESEQIARGEFREGDRRPSNVGRRRNPRCRCDCHRDELENAGLAWHLVEVWLSRQCRRRVSAGLARARRQRDEKCRLRRFT